MSLCAEKEKGGAAINQPMIPGQILAISAQAADQLLAQDNGDAALLYLHLLRHETVAGLRWSQERLDAAFAALEQMKMAPSRAQVTPVVPQPPAADEPPTYTTEEINVALADRQSTFTALADLVEQKLGKKLNVNDLKMLYTIYDHLALPPEVILMLVTWCVEEHARKYGTGRKPYLSQIRKEALVWAQKELFTPERAEEYLQRQAKLHSKEGEMLRLLDLPQRPLVQREADYISGWLDMKFPDEVIRLAYEKTVMKKGTMNWSYMNAILVRWHNDGLHTLEAVQGENKRGRQTVAGAAGQPQSREKDSPRAREDMERMRRLMQKMKDEP